MTDTFAREITYARISLTGCCNLRCRYCMPRGGVPQPHDCLSDDEVLALVRGLAAAGVRKVRFTGGEATVRRICFACSRTYAVPRESRPGR